MTTDNPFNVDEAQIPTDSPVPVHLAEDQARPKRGHAVAPFAMIYCANYEAITTMLTRPELDVLGFCIKEMTWGNLVTMTHQHIGDMLKMHRVNVTSTITALKARHLLVRCPIPGHLSKFFVNPNLTTKGDLRHFVGTPEEEAVGWKMIIKDGKAFPQILAEKYALTGAPVPVTVSGLEDHKKVTQANFRSSAEFDRDRLEEGRQKLARMMIDLEIATARVEAARRELVKAEQVRNKLAQKVQKEAKKLSQAAKQSHTESAPLLDEVPTPRRRRSVPLQAAHKKDHGIQGK